MYAIAIYNLGWLDGEESSCAVFNVHDCPRELLKHVLLSPCLLLWSNERPLAECDDPEYTPFEEVDLVEWVSARANKSTTQELTGLLEWAKDRAEGNDHNRITAALDRLTKEEQARNKMPASFRFTVAHLRTAARQYASSSFALKVCDVLEPFAYFSLLYFRKEGRFECRPDNGAVRSFDVPERIATGLWDIVSPNQGNNDNA